MGVVRRFQEDGDRLGEGCDLEGGYWGRVRREFACRS